MPAKPAALLLALLAAATGVAGVGWLRSAESLRDSRAIWVAGTLAPMASLLRDNQALITELQATPFAEPGNGILESYLLKIRRDGVAKGAAMKQKLDQLAENNTAIVALDAAYGPLTRTERYRSESAKFTHYAIAWRDRWNAVLELFMAGGNYPAATVELPAGFAPAVQAEIEAAH